MRRATRRGVYIFSLLSVALFASALAVDQNSSAFTVLSGTSVCSLVVTFLLCAFSRLD